MNYDTKVLLAGCEPTPAMLRAGCEALAPHNELSGCEAAAVWRAMLAACSPALGDSPVNGEHVARAARAYCTRLNIVGPSEWHIDGMAAALFAVSDQALRSADGFTESESREMEQTLENAAWAMKRNLERAKAAEEDAAVLRQDIAEVYAKVPPLPITAETCDAATDALHWLCIIVGLRDIEIPTDDRWDLTEAGRAMRGGE